MERTQPRVPSGSRARARASGRSRARPGAACALWRAVALDLSPRKPEARRPSTKQQHQQPPQQQQQDCVFAYNDARTEAGSDGAELTGTDDDFLNLLI